MFDIGIGEILVLAVLGLLVFGPDRLPKAAADAARWLRDIRSMAASARKDLSDAAGINEPGGLSDTMNAVKEIRDLHPKRLLGSVLDDKDAPLAPDQDRKQPPAFDPDAA